MVWSGKLGRRGLKDKPSGHGGSLCAGKEAREASYVSCWEWKEGQGCEHVCMLHDVCGLGGKVGGMGMETSGQHGLGLRDWEAASSDWYRIREEV